MWLQIMLGVAASYQLEGGKLTPCVHTAGRGVGCNL